MRLTIVIGAATKPGRLSAAAQALGTAEQEAGADVAYVDLGAAPLDAADGRPLDQASPATQDAVGAIADADAVVFFAPTYRASYPGVLKNLLDLVPLEALLGKPVGIAAMGTSDHHFLGVDLQLRPVLGWFGALLAPVSTYLTGGDFDGDGRLSPERLDELRQLVRTLDALGAAAASPLGPAPLAARG